MVGIMMLVATGNKIIKPIKKISDATKKVANGEFDVEIIKSRNDEIGELTDNFNKMTKELQNMDYLQKDFISNVSHEFKTPITAIDGYVELLDDENLSNEERSEYIKIIKEETKRLTNLTTNALRLSKIEAQEEQQNMEEYSLDEQIRKCILLLEKLWTEKNIEFDLKLKPVKICAEKELVEQVWINIISNAIKYSNDNGKITVSTNIEEKLAVVKIKDRGIGIEEEKINRIFDKFYQADKSHSKEGNGLGLAITNRIINLCNGEIKVKSKLQEGTEFIVKLPVFSDNLKNDKKVQI